VRFALSNEDEGFCVVPIENGPASYIVRRLRVPLRADLIDFSRFFQNRCGAAREKAVSGALRGPMLGNAID
jgi:hypothetical protein